MPDFNSFAPFSDNPITDPEAGVDDAVWQANYGADSSRVSRLKLISMTSNVLGCDHDPHVILLALLNAHQCGVLPDLHNNLTSRSMHRGILLPCVKRKDGCCTWVQDSK